MLSLSTLLIDPWLTKLLNLLSWGQITVKVNFAALAAQRAVRFDPEELEPEEGEQREEQPEEGEQREEQPDVAQKGTTHRRTSSQEDPNSIDRHRHIETGKTADVAALASAELAAPLTNRQRKRLRKIGRKAAKAAKEKAKRAKTRPYRQAKLAAKRRATAGHAECAFVGPPGTSALDLRKHAASTGWRGTPFQGPLLHAPGQLRQIRFE